MDVSIRFANAPIYSSLELNSLIHQLSGHCPCGIQKRFSYIRREESFSMISGMLFIVTSAYLVSGLKFKPKCY